MTGGVAVSRRSFLLGRSHEPLPAVRPPGFLVGRTGACTACGACVHACPTGIVSVSEVAPVLDFSSGECTFCGACGKACPEGLFAEEPGAFGHVAAIFDTCLARLGIACMTCRDSCPQDAIRFRPRTGGPFLPEIDVDTCIGCGACIARCPAEAIGVAPRPQETADG
jgi:ferredoxin-type protein NapF